MIPASTNQLFSAGTGYQISRSVRLRSSASAYFNRTPASAATNGQRWTYSGWVKRGALGAVASILSADAGGGTSGGLYFDTDNTLRFGTGATLHKTSAAVFRDPSAWYHIVVAADSTLATGANRLLLYINGVQQTWTSGTDPTLNGIWIIGKQSTLQGIGFAVGSAASTYFDGYLTEINFIDGQALTPSSFGETNLVTGVWQPKRYTGTYGNNGFYLNFSDPSAATAAAIGKDYSGNGNNWTPNNISVTAGATYDSMLDVPTPWGDGGNGRGNYAVLNPLDTGGTAPSRANLELIAGAAERGVRSTFSIPTTGLWYVEALVGTNQSGATDLAFGLVARTTNLAANPSGIANGWLCYATGNTNITRNGTTTLAGTGAALVSGDILQIAVDLANNKGWIGKNNTWFNGSTGTDGDPATGANPTFTFSSPPELFVLAHCYSSTINVNFGQRPFAYTPPSGFKALNTFNLPEPSIDNGGLYMAATTYTGTGASLSVNNTVNNASFQPDFVWVKGRSGATDHALYDAVRGVQLQLESNTTTAETTETTGLTAFNSNGFTVGALAQMNTNTATYVGWQWKEGATQGFDIVTYTGNGTLQNISHNLGVAPSMMIIRNRTNSAVSWGVYHKSIGNTGNLYLNLTNATNTSSTVWNNTSPTSSVFTVGSWAGVNDSGVSHVAYLFAEVAGFSKFGSYTGNGSADGPFVFCGFRPRWVMMKRTDTTGFSWIIQDTARDPNNPNDLPLYPDLASAEAPSNFIDMLSNGFKLRNLGGGWNASGGTYIFAAFAENPFKYALAR
jgi:hypothetical protein